jgi:TonB family protein
VRAKKIPELASVIQQAETDELITGIEILPSRTKSVSVEPLTRTMPKYPEGARRMGIEGYVELFIQIDKEGTPDSVRVIDSFPPDVFDKAGVEAGYSWRFRPRTVDGKPAAGTAVQRIDFGLPKKK